MMLTDEQVERMVKDSNFVGEHHPSAPLMHVDLCSHVMALAAEREELKGRLLLARHKLDLLHNATIVLRNGMGGHRHWDETQRAGAGCKTCIQQIEARKEAARLIEEAGQIE